MNETLKNLFESKVLDDATKAAIKEAFDSAIASAKKEAGEKVRTDIAERYKQDRARLVGAMDTMLREAVENEFTDLKTDVELLRKLKATYAQKIAEAKSQGKKDTARAMKVFEQFIRSAMAKEIKEFRDDRAKQRSASVKAITEARADQERQKERFIERGAVVLENVMKKKLGKFIAEAREDIESAKKNDMGRKIFEAFASEYAATHFNSDEQMKALAEQLAAVTAEKDALKKRVTESTQAFKQRLLKETTEKKKLEEASTRQKTLVKLLGQLSGDARAQMKPILEAAETSKLEATFKKMLPLVAKTAPKGKSDGNVRLDESTIKTGSKGALKEGADADSEILELRRRLNLSPNK